MNTDKVFTYNTPSRYAIVDNGKAVGLDRKRLFRDAMQHAKLNQFDNITMDAAAYYNIGELEYVVPELFIQKYEDLVGLRIVPPFRDVPRYANDFSYFAYDLTAGGDFEGQRSDSYEYASFNRIHKTQPMRVYATGFAYDIDELVKSMQTLLPVDTAKMLAVTTEYNHFVDNHIWFGDKRKGVNAKGILNTPDINEVADTTFNPAAPDAQVLYNLLMTSMNNVFLKSKGRYLPDTLTLPLAMTAQASTLTLKTADGGGIETVLEAFNRNNITQVKGGRGVVIESTSILDSFNGKAFIIASVNDPLVWRMPVSYDLEFTPDVILHDKIKRKAKAKFGDISIIEKAGISRTKLTAYAA